MFGSLFNFLDNWSCSLFCLTKLIFQYLTKLSEIVRKSRNAEFSMGIDSNFLLCLTNNSIFNKALLSCQKRYEF